MICNRILNILLLFQVLFYSSSAFCQQDYYPDQNWQTKKPAEVNIDAHWLDSAVKFALNHETKTDYDLRIANLKAYANEPNYTIVGPTKPRGKPAGLILRHGYIIAQWGDINRVDMTFSVTKSFLSTVAGLAFDSKLIQNIDDKVKSYVWDDQFEGEHNSKITWRHLLNQSSDWSGCLFGQCDWADRPPKSGGIDDWKNRKLLEPGTQFEYNDVRVNLLAYSLLQVFRKPLPVVLKERIMDPIGASSTWRWYGYDNSWINIDGIMIQSVSGGGHFGGGLFISAQDQARFGLLFLRNGKWKNQQVISSNWVNAVSIGSPSNKSYGLLWWTNRDKEFAGLSSEIYYADGFGGNYIVIDQPNDIVVVARWLEPDKLGDFLTVINKAIQGGR
ncbi:serine hydrolase domain-containing protein [Flavihumibacter profundi]|jgi:CubicO group peptidase (beta-lactamase class C family)|uniref:serine hydrolase domain-containing protein n=1 Tax=Flavihumibacter profundi TaxID=2716883 RepID=UPI001CC769D1|nr:serine hydrolase [Flavihumibacter profundi]MBZ5856606.1 beta-lactamase family protein [Flavihumibacter profundi]